ncbi:class I SAM-dependent methyltransferase [Leptospira sp. WS92.C1]
MSLEEAPDTLAHLYLNTPNNSSWANLGYWKDTNDYPTACKTLAILLGKKADLNSEMKVLDLGFGCGDQFLVWQEEFSLDLSHLTGINPSRVQVEFTKRRLDSIPGFIPKLICAPLDFTLAKLEDNSVDRILCLDSAYFFENRIRFCKEAYRILKPGGALVSAELILKDSQLGILDTWFRNWICTLSSIPFQNRVTPDSLSKILLNSGFITGDFEFLEEFVFAGFANWIRKKTQSGQKEIPQKIANKYRRFGEFLGGEKIRNYFRFVLYSAQKPF